MNSNLITKQYLIERVAAATRCQTAYVSSIVDETLASIVSLLSDETRKFPNEATSIILSGFGTFQCRPTKATKRHNIYTRREEVIPAGYRIVFRPAPAFKQAVKGLKEEDGDL